MGDAPIRRFLEIPYDELEELNLEAKSQRAARVDPEQIAEQRRKYLNDEKLIKAVTVCFTDIEGRLHILDYDKKFLLKSADQLTFDGSSIRGFTSQADSDLRLGIDWSAFYWLPADVFGPGKVIVFGEVLNRDGTPFPADFRARLKELSKELWEKDRTAAHVSAEIEGFLFQGPDAERNYYEARKFDLLSTGGYFHSLPQDPLRNFIDAAAEVQRAMAFSNEKDHPEVGPSQFEMNFSHAEASIAADHIQLYKLICRQVAQKQGITASFLPKPITGINGSGMHTNMSLMRDGKNLFFDESDPDHMSPMARKFIDRILHSADDVCLILNPSVNSYRRLDPHYEAPNEIKASGINRAAMIRIPLAAEPAARIEVRSVSPDANPYMLIYSLLKTGLEGPEPKADDGDKRPRTRVLPDNIYSAIRHFKRSQFVQEVLGEGVHEKYLDVKKMSADRCPRALGTTIKPAEIMYHHEVTNQMLWNMF